MKTSKLALCSHHGTYLETLALTLASTWKSGIIVQEHENSKPSKTFRFYTGVKIYCDKHFAQLLMDIVFKGAGLHNRKQTCYF